ncbi:MAG: phosphopantothenate/pantothenate synthetase [Aigarchaeota archaeon]|nr:phosphopantothenate/pantothenate synthetase [Aigarchaeota archaeon]MDW8093299.1 phosphopantothenate/pantothenate synthetase [Nitrososphaerota archaeon]
MEDATIPESHPRYWSLIKRRRIVEGYRRGIVVIDGLISHGRGEAIDYIIGEVTHQPALEAAKAATASLLTASRPVISVNGNSAALAGGLIVELAAITGAVLEVNLFHWSAERAYRIRDHLMELGAVSVLVPDGEEKVYMEGLKSERGRVCRNGILAADTVLVSIEDGDRTEALRAAGKRVLAIDLNPFSRTAQRANVTIVDEIERALSNMIRLSRELRDEKKEELLRIVECFDNALNLSEMIGIIRDRLGLMAGLEGCEDYD